MKKSIQVSITAPSYVQQCLDFKSSGVEALALIIDAASMNRMARSCEQVGYFPKVMPTRSVSATRSSSSREQVARRRLRAAELLPVVRERDPGRRSTGRPRCASTTRASTSGALPASAGRPGALLVAAAAELSPTNPTTADLLKGLYAFKGQKWTGLGGLAGPRTFVEGGTPKVPYCLFTAISNATNTGWASSVTTPQCTDTLAPSDPQLTGKG